MKPTKKSKASNPSQTKATQKASTLALCSQHVFQEIVHRGRGTAKTIAARLARRGLKYRIKDVQQSLDEGLASGTFALSQGETHLASATLEIMR